MTYSKDLFQGCIKNQGNYARPPLTSSEAPVMYFDLEEARNEATSAISEGAPKPPRGI